MARPRKKAAGTEQVVQNLAGFGCTMAEIATALELSVSTLRRRPKLMAAIEAGRESGKTTLRRAMWHNAIDGNNTTMQIWLSKNLLGYSDKVIQEQTQRGGVLVVPGTIPVKDWTAAMLERAAKQESDAELAGKWVHGKFVGAASDNGGH